MLGGGVHPACSVLMLGARAWPQAASLGHHLWGIRKKDLERVDCGELATSLLLKLTFPRLERKPSMVSGVVVTIAKMEEVREALFKAVLSFCHIQRFSVFVLQYKVQEEREAGSPEGCRLRFPRVSAGVRPGSSLGSPWWLLKTPEPQL